MNNIVLVLLIVGTMLLGTVIFQRHLIYLPYRGLVQPSQWQAADMKSVQLVTRDKLTIHAWYKPAKSNQPTIVYFHGNAGHLGYRIPLIRPYLRQGFGVLLLSYRGYGGNPGRPTEQGLYNDARAAIGFLQQHQVKSRCIVLYGESLGTGVAVQMANEYDVGAVVLQSPYTSLLDMARRHYFFLPAKWLLWDKFDSISKIKTMKSPLLVIYGLNDRIVPSSQSEHLFAAASFPKQAKSFANNGHNDMNPSQLTSAVMMFLSQHLSCMN